MFLKPNTHHFETGVSATNTRRREIHAELARLISEYFGLIPELPTAQCPLSVPLYGPEEVTDALAALLAQDVTMGARVRAFESKFAEFIGAKHAIMVNSGSSANLLALAVLSHRTLPGCLKEGDEVIVPALAWSTTVSPVLQHGCIPVMVDVDPATLNLRPDRLHEALSAKTRAIMPVHLLGNPVDMAPLTEIAHTHNLWVIEDTCESLGSSINSRHVGTFGHFGTYSFFFSHHITTMEGGMLVTDSDAMADLAKSLRAHGWTRDMSSRQAFEEENPLIDPRFLFANVGYNLRPMEIQAAFGLIQMDRLSGFNEQRRLNAQYLLRELADCSNDIAFVTEQPGGRSTWFGFPVLLKDAQTRQGLSKHLEARNIATRPIVAGNLAAQPAFRNSNHRTVGPLENATRIGETGLFVGNHPNLTKTHLDHMVEGFKSYFKNA